MALFDKLGDLVKNFSEKTTDAIETGRLNSRIISEKAAAAEALRKIGEHYYNLFLTNGQAAPEVTEFCEAAKAHYNAAAKTQAEVDRIRAESEAAKTSAASASYAAPDSSASICEVCGTGNLPNTKFCQECGAKLPLPAELEKRTCQGCGAEVATGIKFCNECGTRIE